VRSRKARRSLSAMRALKKVVNRPEARKGPQDTFPNWRAEKVIAGRQRSVSRRDETAAGRLGNSPSLAKTTGREGKSGRNRDEPLLGLEK